jgi:hypothetical protein
MIVKPIHTGQSEDDSVPARDLSSKIDRWVLQKIHDSVGRPPIRLLLGNGVQVLNRAASPVSTILIRTAERLQFAVATAGSFLLALWKFETGYRPR